MTRRNISGTSPCEAVLGSSRAVRVGQQVFVAGATATDAAGQLVGNADASLQTRQMLANIAAAPENAGACFASVVRTRIFVADIQRAWEAAGRARGEVFADIRPACTMATLIDPHMLVEIEADALAEAPVPLTGLHGAGE